MKHALWLLGLLRKLFVEDKRNELRSHCVFKICQLPHNPAHCYVKVILLHAGCCCGEVVWKCWQYTYDSTSLYAIAGFNLDLSEPVDFPSRLLGKTDTVERLLSGRLGRPAVWVNVQPDIGGAGPAPRIAALWSWPRANLDQCDRFG